MAKFTVRLAGSYGKRGEIVELEVPSTDAAKKKAKVNSDGLTDRQALMLIPYKAPKGVEDEIAALKAKVKELEKAQKAEAPKEPVKE